MIPFVRVDNRLIHGQVVEAWLPELKVGRVVVADDEAAKSPLIRAAMGLAMPSSIEVRIQPVADVPYAALAADKVKTLILFRDVTGPLAAHDKGLALALVNLGNVHFATGRRQVSPSVFLAKEELEKLRALSRLGVEVEARAVPAERPVSLTEMVERFDRGG